jgi:carboxymethylenebutenolidase
MQELGKVADVAVLWRRGAAVDQQAGGITRLDRDLGDQRWIKVVIEILDAHEREATSACCLASLAVPADRIETLNLPDGETDVHRWLPTAGHGPGVLLVHEIFGVADYIQSVAARLAAAGYVVGVPDLFWRFAPRWTGTADESGTAEALEKASALDHDQAVDDLGAALELLAGLPEVDGVPATLGFCLGGTLAFGVAIRFEPAACVSYYGSGVPSMLERLEDVHCPTLFHFGSLDRYIPGEGVDAVAEATAGHPHLTLNVEIAGHAFDNVAPMFHDEAAARSAWSKTMAFLAAHVPVT